MANNKTSLPNSVLITLKLTALYLFFFLLRWIIFKIMGQYDSVWHYATVYRIPVIAFTYSLLCSLWYRERLGYYILSGTVFGFIAGYITNAITRDNQLPVFENGYIVLFICINIFTLIGLISLYPRKKHNNTALLTNNKKPRYYFLVAIFAILMFISIFITTTRLSYQYGAKIGYKEGFEQGVLDKENGVPKDNLTKYISIISQKYPPASAKCKGYIMYWLDGYQNGYNTEK